MPEKMVKVLFVCMGNICRSPAAEGVFRKLAKERGLEKDIQTASAGTIGYHAGEPADLRMRRAAESRGYELHRCARQVTRQDLEHYDYVLACDQANYTDLLALDREGLFQTRIRMLTDFHPDPGVHEVPDPYYGGPQGFEHVLDLVEVACAGLLDDVEEYLRTEATQ